MQTALWCSGLAILGLPAAVAGNTVAGRGGFVHNEAATVGADRPAYRGPSFKTIGL